MGIIINIVKQSSKKIILCISFLLAEVFLAVMIPFVVMTMLDQSMQRSGTLLLFMLGGVLVTGMVSGRYTARIAAFVSTELRSRMYRTIQRITREKLEAITNSGLLTRMTKDTINIQNAMQLLLGSFLRSLFLLTGTMLVIFFISPLSGVIFLTLLIICTMAVLGIGKQALSHFAAGLSVYDALNQSVKENVIGMRIIKAFVKEADETERFRSGSQLMYQHFVTAEQIAVHTNPVITFMLGSGFIMAIAIGSSKVIAAAWTAGKYLLLVTYSANLLMTAVALFGALFGGLMMIPSVQRIAEIFLATQEEQPPEQYQELTAGTISFEQLSCCYSVRPALTGISLAIPAGAVVGVVGATGSGKSTFAQLIPRLYRASEGQIKIDGIPIEQYPVLQLRRKIGFVEQESILFSGTIKENLYWGNETASADELSRAVAIAGADEFIEALPQKLDTVLLPGGVNLSGGQRQRLCIARAILKNPRILILDDAVSAVDAALSRQIYQQIKESLTGVTIIMISQKIRAVVDCDKIFVFDGGKLAGSGMHQQLKKENQIYQELIQSQLSGGDFDAD